MCSMPLVTSDSSYFNRRFRTLNGDGGARDFRLQHKNMNTASQFVPNLSTGRVFIDIHSSIALLKTV